MFFVPKIIWKPLIQKIVTGRWKNFRMKSIQPPFPSRMNHAGLYLHVPFCKSLCPFCPYNRVLYEEDTFIQYENAVHQEIELYASSLSKTRFVSFYIGGGTPTVNIDGLLRILHHIKTTFSLSCEICVELHPANMEDDYLAALKEAGITMLSIGIESTNDRILKKIGRSHDGKTALDALQRAKCVGFDSINVDLMFALPDQTISDWEKDLQLILNVGVDQISTYPMFAFPYSEMGQQQHLRMVRRPKAKLVRSMLKLADNYAERNGLKRCAVWSWLRPSKKKFSSITRHYYVGLGPSAASMIGSHFYVNTFNVNSYVSNLPDKRPIALSIPFDRQMEMAYWLYWRIYELNIKDSDLKEIFGVEESLFTRFRSLFWPLQCLGMAEKKEGSYHITDFGAYWVHRLQNEYSLNFINKLWGTCRVKTWPEEVIL